MGARQGAPATANVTRHARSHAARAPGGGAPTAQADFSQWVDLFNFFDAWFDEHVKPRKDFALEAHERPDNEFHTDTCLQMLRVTTLVLDNCSSKHLYGSAEVNNPHPPPASCRPYVRVSPSLGARYVAAARADATAAPPPPPHRTALEAAAGVG